MDIIEKIKSQTSWGCRQVVALHPIYGLLLSKHMLAIDKTVLSYTDVIQALYEIVAKRVNYNFYNEFPEQILTMDKTMIGKKEAIQILQNFMEASSDDHPTIVDVVLDVDSKLKNNNSYKAVIMSFKESFIKLNIGG